MKKQNTISVTPDILAQVKILRELVGKLRKDAEWLGIGETPELEAEVAEKLEAFLDALF